MKKYLGINSDVAKHLMCKAIINRKFVRVVNLWKERNEKLVEAYSGEFSDAGNALFFFFNS